MRSTFKIVFFDLNFGFRSDFFAEIILEAILLVAACLVAEPVKIYIFSNASGDLIKLLHHHKNNAADGSESYQKLCKIPKEFHDNTSCVVFYPYYIRVLIKKQ